MTISEEPCGECSYQQSCGRQCHRKGELKDINPLFVAERRCSRLDQSNSCVSKNIDNCRLWPNPRVSLPNVTDAIKDIVNGFDYLTCIPEQRYVKENIFPEIKLLSSCFYGSGISWKKCNNFFLHSLNLLGILLLRWGNILGYRKTRFN